MQFKEIEHKFVVDERFDLEAFARSLDTLGPVRRASIRVLDRYFLTEDGRAKGYVIRHRFDAELHQLTMKELADDSEVRDEITIDLGHHAGDQVAQVDAFVSRLGVRWAGAVEKDLRVWYFPDCEVVHYLASGGGQTVRCVEFEATAQDSLPEALGIVERYERATGFDARTRSKHSLVELLFPGTLSR
jgi:adenylate cyclase class IV